MEHHRLVKAIECLKMLDGKTSLESIGKAVYESHLNRPAPKSYEPHASLLLKELARELGVKCLTEVKSSRFLSANQQGKAFLRKSAGRIYSEIEKRNQSIEKSLDSARREIGGSVPIDLAMTFTLSTRWLTHFEGFLAQSSSTRHIRLNPDLKLLSSTIEDAVDSGKFELGVLHLPDKTEPLNSLKNKFEVVPILRDPFVAVAGPEHPLAKFKSLSIERFRNAGGYCRYTKGRAGTTISVRLEESGISLEPDDEFEDISSLPGVVTSHGSDRFAIVPALAVTDSHVGITPKQIPRRLGDAFIIELKNFGGPRRIGFIRKHSVSLSEPIQTLEAALRKYGSSHYS